MGRPIQDVTIVGGGTSGWISACFLARKFQPLIKAGTFRVTLIESEKIGIVGVGESTARPMADLLRFLGINESEFIRRCNVTFKLSGWFKNWNVDSDGEPISWVNPFYTQSDIEGLNPGFLFSQFAMHPGGGPIGEGYTEAMSVCPAIIRANKGPRAIGKGDYQADVPYSYHMNAVELAKMLAERGRELGVNHILDQVTDVNLDERGFVRSLSLEEHGDHPIEFVIDASGFASIIIGKAMGEPFESYDNYLLNDRAVVSRLPHEDPTKIEPTSRATGMKAGWSFRVPLFDQVGSGYIYSSKFISDDEAISEFKAHCGPIADTIEPRIIRMRIGKTRRSLVKNCLAIGLSSGFVEPLEATAIYSVQLGLAWLVKYLPNTDFSPAVERRYNEQVDMLYSEIVDFIAMMFYLSNRDDSEFWRTVRHELEIPETLQAKLELWKDTMPDPLDLAGNTFFTANSYLSALMGKGFYKGRTYMQAVGFPKTLWDRYVMLRKQRTQGFLNALPDHYTLLQHIRGEAPPPSVRPQFNPISVRI
ncbi:MAG: tryptophan 7-halogenase [Henriciella sp.]|nr:tryptophan 7-halogenase [Henriciella sp.]